jgi:hypothetical protein
MSTKELNLDKLADYTREELEFYVRMLALRLEKSQADVQALKAKANRTLGFGGKKNPHVK